MYNVCCVISAVCSVVLFGQRKNDVLESDSGVVVYVLVRIDTKYIYIYIISLNANNRYLYIYRFRCVHM